MKNLLYAVMLTLIVAWLIGFLGYNQGGVIHLLLVMAAMAMIIRTVEVREKSKSNKY